MRGARGPVFVPALCCFTIILLVTSVGVAAADTSEERSASELRQATIAGGGTGSAPPGPAQTVSTVVVEQEFAALPDRPGEVSVTRRFEIPENVRALRTRLPEDATVDRTSDDFQRIEDGRFEWTGGDRTPWITHTLSVNQTGDVAGPEGADGRYLFADVGEWGLFRRPSTPTNVEYVGSAIRFDERVSTAGPGVAGDRMVYVGEHEEVSRRADGQLLRMVVPAAADVAEPRDAILSSVADASTSLRVGQRDDEVVMIAAPLRVDWAVRGLQTGDSDMYVLANEHLDRSDNTWLHEYVHTRQDFNLTDETRWLAEATATYYAALLGMDQDHISFDQFRRQLAAGTASRYESVVLAQPATWVQGANYRKGGLVTGELDRRLRLATDSSTDFQAVFRQLNARSRATDAATVATIVGRVGTDEVARAATRYTMSSSAPSVWGVAAHGEAFGQLPPRIDVALPADVSAAAYTVAGPYRNRTLGESPFVLVPGERLGIDVQLTNSGGTVGEYNLTYGIEGGPRESLTGSLDAEESVTEALTVEVRDLGEQAVQVGEHSIPVTVVEPAEATIATVSANRTDVDPGAPVGLTAELVNDADSPGERDLAVTRDGTTLANRTVRLDAGASRTVTLPVRLSERGTYTLSVDGHTVTVQVGDGGIADALGPGVGPVGAVVALFAAVALAIAVARARESP